MKLFHKPKIRRYWVVMVWVFLFAISLSCQGVKPVVKPIEIQPEPVPRVALAPGDAIDIKFFYTPELNDSQTVRPDGKITLQLVGEVMVHGKTTDELRDELIKLYTPELKRPEVVVIIRSLYDRRVYVGGEVKKPGLISMPGSLTVLEALMGAGGFNLEAAKLKTIIVIRQKDGQYKGTLLDLRDALAGKEAHPFFLEPHDVVYVPQTTIVKVDQWVEQHIYKLLPRLGATWIPFD